MSKIRPLIVCGMGRSGTRMCANILNNSDLVELQGEIGGPAGTKMVIWLEAARRQRHNESSDGVYALARAAFQLGSAGRALDTQTSTAERSITPFRALREHLQRSGQSRDLCLLPAQSV